MKQQTPQYISKLSMQYVLVSLFNWTDEFSNYVKNTAKIGKQQHNNVAEYAVVFVAQCERSIRGLSQTNSEVWVCPCHKPPNLLTTLFTLVQFNNKQSGIPVSLSKSHQIRQSIQKLWIQKRF